MFSYSRFVTISIADNWKRKQLVLLQSTKMIFLQLKMWAEEKKRFVFVRYLFKLLTRRFSNLLQMRWTIFFSWTEMLINSKLLWSYRANIWVWQTNPTTENTKFKPSSFLLVRVKPFYWGIWAFFIHIMISTWYCQMLHLLGENKRFDPISRMVLLSNLR